MSHFNFRTLTLLALACALLLSACGGGDNKTPTPALLTTLAPVRAARPIVGACGTNCQFVLRCRLANLHRGLQIRRARTPDRLTHQ